VNSVHQRDAARHPSRATKRSTKRSLLALSHAMERSVDVGREWVPDGQPSLIISLFQRRHYFDVERERYAQLAADGRTCIVAFSGRVDDLPAGVHGVALDDTDALAREWVLIVLDGGLGTSLVARDIDDLLPGADTLEAGRLFEGRWSFSTADAIEEAERILVSLGDRLPVDVVAAAHDAISAASASRVSLAERRLAAVTDVLVSSVDDAYFRAERMEGLARREKELSEHDPLTGLANRRFLERFMTLNKHDAPMRMSALLVDLDGLKSINDEHSHLAGDVAIQHTARVLTEVTRPQDVVVRMGGDEFLILLPGVGEDEAMRVGTRIVDRIGGTHLPEPWQQVGLGASVGVQVASSAGFDLEALDASLYRAKREGKGRVHLA
jgi:diguanylate cyclase (GGDEF)-like protein